MKSKAIVAAALAALCIGAPARADTWVVDDDGPANFRDLPEAVAAARDGDTLFVRAGHYSACKLERKGLRIVGAGPASVVIERSSDDGPFFAASELTVRQSLLLAGIHGIGRGGTLTLERCASSVVLCDLVVESKTPVASGGGPRLENCANAFIARVALLPGSSGPDGGATGLQLIGGNVSLSQVVAIGGNGATAKSPFGKGGTGEVGLAVIDSSVDAALCEFVGGDGGGAQWDLSAPFCPEAATAGPGGSGLYVGGRSDVLLAGDGIGQLRGGNGGAGFKDPWDDCWSFAADGGAGIRFRADESKKSVVVSRVPYVGGKGGTAGGRRDGQAGDEVDGDADLVTRADHDLPTLAVAEPGVFGGPFQLTVRGHPGDAVTILISSQLGRTRLKGLKGFPLHALPGDIWFMFQPGRIGVDGTFVFSEKLPKEKLMVGRCFVLQALVIPPPASGREALLTNFDLLTVADGAAPALHATR